MCLFLSIYVSINVFIIIYSAKSSVEHNNPSRGHLIFSQLQRFFIPPVHSSTLRLFCICFIPTTFLIRHLYPCTPPVYICVLVLEKKNAHHARVAPLDSSSHTCRSTIVHARWVHFVLNFTSDTRRSDIEYPSLPTMHVSLDRKLLASSHREIGENREATFYIGHERCIHRCSFPALPLHACVCNVCTYCLLRFRSINNAANKLLDVAFV